MNLKMYEREVKDFPSEGILFRDITTVLKNPEALFKSIDLMQKAAEDSEFDLILGPESRGFIFGMPLAYNLRKGFIPVRKAGKLPAEVVRKEYELEYGTAVIEMHKDAVEKGAKVLVVDDLLATGGTAKAIAAAVEELGAEVAGFLFFIELTELNGRSALEGYEINSILKY